MKKCFLPNKAYEVEGVGNFSGIDYAKRKNCSPDGHISYIQFPGWFVEWIRKEIAIAEIRGARNRIIEIHKALDVTKA